ncbi:MULTISPECIES: DUF6712 family protein [Olivibacter]|uniref:DUF6712 family protein n=1 Tax=Olivibacter jilunii TaxID=985016 RepID=A0ABW6AVZ3_9SPHI
MKSLITTIEEMQMYLSFNKSIGFGKLKPHVERTQREKMQSLLGKDLYDELASAYESANNKVDGMPEHMQELMQNIQDAITNIVFLSFLAQGQLVLGDSGFRLAVNENEKTAFQWQIEDFKYQLGLDGFNALDRVLSYLEKNKDSFPNWSISEAYFEQKKYLVDTAVKFNDHYYINDSRMTYLSVRYIMNRIEQHVVKPLYGTKLFNKIKEKFKIGTMSSAEKYLLTNHLEPGITLLTVAKGVIERSLNLLDAGVSVNLYSYYANLKIYDKKLRSLDDKSDMVQQLQDDGNAFLQAGKDYVEQHKDEFPEYEESDLPISIFQIINNEDRKFFGV